MLQAILFWCGRSSSFGFSISSPYNHRELANAVKRYAA
jgi:hypothetical protein